MGGSYGKKKLSHALKEGNAENKIISPAPGEGNVEKNK